MKRNVVHPRRPFSSLARIRTRSSAPRDAPGPAARRVRCRAGRRQPNATRLPDCPARHRWPEVHSRNRLGQPGRDPRTTPFRHVGPPPGTWGRRLFRVTDARRGERPIPDVVVEFDRRRDRWDAPSARPGFVARDMVSTQAASSRRAELPEGGQVVGGLAFTPGSWRATARWQGVSLSHLGGWCLSMSRATNARAGDLRPLHVVSVCLVAPRNVLPPLRSGPVLLGDPEPEGNLTQGFSSGDSRPLVAPRNVLPPLRSGPVLRGLGRRRVHPEHQGNLTQSSSSQRPRPLARPQHVVVGSHAFSRPCHGTAQNTNLRGAAWPTDKEASRFPPGLVAPKGRVAH